MNILREKEKLELGLNNRKNDYQNNIDRINIAKEKIDKEAELKKQHVDERYNMIQTMYKNQIDQIERDLIIIEKQIKNLCSYKASLIIEVITNILFDITGLEFTVGMINTDNENQNQGYITFTNNDKILIIKEAIDQNVLDKSLSVYKLHFEGTKYLVGYLTKIFEDITYAILDNHKLTLPKAYELIKGIDNITKRK